VHRQFELAISGSPRNIRASLLVLKAPESGALPRRMLMTAGSGLRTK
jgi:hypothetical protein